MLTSRTSVFLANNGQHTGSDQKKSKVGGGGWGLGGGLKAVVRLNLTRTHHGVGVGSPLQVVATLGVGVRSDAQAVGRVELLHEEGAACLDHRGQLEEAGGREQRLDGVLPQLQSACGDPGSAAVGLKTLNGCYVESHLFFCFFGVFAVCLFFFRGPNYICSYVCSCTIMD